MFPIRTSTLDDLVDCLHRRHHIGRLADRVGSHRVGEGRMSLLSGEAHSHQVHRRTELLEEDSLADHMLADRNLETGHSAVREVGSRERGNRSLEDTGCMDWTF